MPPASGAPKNPDNPAAQTYEQAVDIKVGQTVKVIQQIVQRDEVWSLETLGEVVKVEQSKTGSWYAHGKDDKLWLDRLHLRKDDGEIVVCNLDRFSRVEVL